jgi:hypothetical protein
LPSRDELNEVCKYARDTRQAAGAATRCSGGTLRTGFASGFYWSSYETAAYARSQYFTNGLQPDGDKSDSNYVRPVRGF